MHGSLLTLSAVALLCGGALADDSAFLQPSMQPINEQFVSMFDSKLPRNKNGVKEVEVKGASWVRVAFDRDTLKGNFRIQIKSKLDGHTQHLNSTTMSEWQYSSAFFNGPSVEITVEGGSPPSVSGAIAGQESGVSTICGPTDDRTPASAARAARYMGSGGCSGWLIRDEMNCFLSAGHCGTNGQGGGTMEFNVPLSSPTGVINHPAPSDQYAVDPESVQFENAGVGFDWMYLGCFANSETGLTAYEAQADAYELTLTVPQEGDYTQKYGHGTTAPRNELSQTQQFHGLPDSYVDQGNDDTARYTIDTTGGDSGSAVESSEGIAFAVHTHGGCTSAGTGSNAGTLLHRAPLQLALANPQGVCSPSYQRKY